MKRRRGFLIIIGLFLLIIVLTLGMSAVGRKVAQYRAAVKMGPSAQALQMAESGLVDALLKLSKDPNFPPLGDDTQQIYTYSEPFYDLNNTTVLGSYEVVVDRTRRSQPYYLILLTSTGTVGATDKPVAQRRLYAELDVASKTRDFAGPNPYFYRLVNWQDLGSP